MSTNASMKALVLESCNAPLGLVEVPRPVPGSGQALVRIHASGVNPDGTPAGALIVIGAKDFAEAKAIADSDPYQKTGLRGYTLRTVNEGSYGLRVNYSDQTVTTK
jgi:hypothetical protein